MKETETRLSELNIGEKCTVIGFDSAQSRKQRLMDLGLISGARILCISASPFGNPKAYVIRGSVIAIRNSDADCVKVSKLP